MRKTLTDRTLKALKPAPAGKRTLLMDSMVPSLGVSVTDRGSVSFILLKRFPGKAPTRRALGTYPTMTLEEARTKTRVWLELIAKGVDPKDAERDQRAAEQSRRAATFGAMAEDYIKRHLKGQRRAKDSEREIRKELLSRWADKPVTEITRRDIVAMADEIADRGARRQALNMLGHAKTIFNWAINRGTYGLEISPCDRIKPGQLIGERRVRQRVLSDDELRAIWRASGRVGYPFGPLYRLLLVTGQRKSEVAEAQWGEFNLERRLWTIPPERFKSDATHLVPLSGDSLAVLEQLPRWRGDYLFSTTGGKVPVSGFSKAKARLDARVLRTLKAMARQRGDDPSKVKLEPWVLHDLRRTVRTRLSALRVPHEVAEMVIGHARKGLSRVYDQHQYADEMREALEAWAARLRSIVAPPPPNVVPIREEVD